MVVFLIILLYFKVELNLFCWNAVLLFLAGIPFFFLKESYNNKKSFFFENVHKLFLTLFFLRNMSWDNRAKEKTEQ